MCWIEGIQFCKYDNKKYPKENYVLAYIYLYKYQSIIITYTPTLIIYSSYIPILKYKSKYPIFNYTIKIFIFGDTNTAQPSPRNKRRLHIQIVNT